MAVRVTAHGSRAGKHGVFSAKHNDRNYDVSAADNINPNPPRKNVYLIFSPSGDMTKNPSITFDDHERAFYTEMFNDALEAQNEKHRKKGNYDRVKSIDDYRTSIRTCPEEYLFQFGNREDQVDYKALNWAVTAWIETMQNRYGSNWRLLDAALHMDESTPHIHVRAVWVHETANGHLVSQTKALEAMGVERPDPSKPKSQYNNPKQTWSADSRETLVEYARQVGIEVIDTPVEPGKRSMSLEEYVYNKTHEEVQILTAQREKLQQETAQLVAEREQLEQEVVALREEKSRLKRLTERLRTSCMTLFKKLAQLVCYDGRCALEHVKFEAQDVLDAQDELSRDELEK